MKERMHKLAQLLGTKFGKPFRILKGERFLPGSYIITNDGLWYRKEAGCLEEPCEKEVLADLVTGKAKAFSTSRELKKGDKYWSFLFDWEAREYVWKGDELDDARFILEAIFRTEEEARKALPGFREKLEKGWKG